MPKRQRENNNAGNNHKKHKNTRVHISKNGTMYILVRDPITGLPRWKRIN